MSNRSKDIEFINLLLFSKKKLNCGLGARKFNFGKTFCPGSWMEPGHKVLLARALSVPLKMTFCPGSCLEPGQKGPFRPGWSHQPGLKVSPISPLPPPSPSHSFSSLSTRRSARNHHDAVRLPDFAAVLLLLHAPLPPARRP